jgi:hypothetical protein
MQRGAPPLKGQKPLPQGAAGCLTGLTFVISGVLDSLEREEMTDLIKSYGGCGAACCYYVWPKLCRIRLRASAYNCGLAVCAGTHLFLAFCSGHVHAQTGDG